MIKKTVEVALYCWGDVDSNAAKGEGFMVCHIRPNEHDDGACENYSRLTHWVSADFVLLDADGMIQANLAGLQAEATQATDTFARTMAKINDRRSKILALTHEKPAQPEPPPSSYEAMDDVQI